MVEITFVDGSKIGTASEHIAVQGLEEQYQEVAHIQILNKGRTLHTIVLRDVDQLAGLIREYGGPDKVAELIQREIEKEEN